MLRSNPALIFLMMKPILGRLQLTAYPSRWDLLTSTQESCDYFEDVDFWVILLSIQAAREIKQQ